MNALTAMVKRAIAGVPMSFCSGGGMTILQCMHRLPRPAMKMPTLLSSLFVAAAVMLSGCNSKQAPPAVGPPQVVVAVVEPRDVSITREWIGRLDGSANVDVRARVQGYIDEIAFKEGTVVKEGDLLLRIDPRELEIRRLRAKKITTMQYRLI